MSEMDDIDLAPDAGVISAIIDLQGTLRAVGQLDPSNPDHGPSADYARRNMLVVQALGYAMAAGYPCGFRAIEPDAPQEFRDYGVVYIDLPTGQVSWHVPLYRRPYDGHKHPDVYARIAEYLSHAPGA